MSIMYWTKIQLSPTFIIL